MIAAPTSPAARAVNTPVHSVAWYVDVQRRRVILLAALAVIASLFYIAFVLLQPIVSPVTLFTWLLLIAIAAHPRVGLYFAFAIVGLFEAGNADGVMVAGAYFHGGLSSTLGLPGAIASPLEMLLLLTLGFWLAKGAMQRRLDFRGGHLGWPMFAFFFCLVSGIFRGVLGGGNVNIALWESRFLFYMVICYFLATNTIRKPAHVRQLLAVTLVTTSLWAIEGVYRRVALIDTGLLGVIPEFAYSHEVVIFLGALLLLIVAHLVFGAPVWQRLLGMVMLPVGMFTLLATERRSGYISIMIAFLAIALIFLVAKRKAFFLIALPVLLGAAIYLPLFWNNTSMLGQPARAVRSLREPDPRDAASNLYRIMEKVNVRATIRANPLLGVGFGREFMFVVGLPDLSWWPFWRFEPHHNILWIWLKTGAPGFIAFFTMMGTALARAAYTVRRQRLREAKVFALLTVSGIVCCLVFSYVDLGFTSGRVTVFLGTLLGGLAVLDRLEGVAELAAEPLAERAAGRPAVTSTQLSSRGQA